MVRKKLILQKAFHNIHLEFHQKDYIFNFFLSIVILIL